jgi:hypothetical protein
MHIDPSQPYGTLNPDNDPEGHDIMLITARNTVRKLLDLIKPKMLQVQLEIQCPMTWRCEDAIAASFLLVEPFEQLHCDRAILLPAIVRIMARDARGTKFIGKKIVIDEGAKSTDDFPSASKFVDLQRAWVKTVEGSESRMVTQSKELSEAREHARIIHREIEELFERVPKMALPSISGCERRRYRAILAYENADVQALHEILKSIVQRWIDYHEVSQSQLSPTASVVQGMFALDGRWRSNLLELSLANIVPAELRKLELEFPGIYEFERGKPQRQLAWELSDGSIWSEDTAGLNYNDVVPGPEDVPDDEDVTSWDDRERRYFRKGDNTWTRLIFPRSVMFSPVLQRISVMTNAS